MASFSDELKLIDGVHNLRNQFRQTFDCLGHLQLRLEEQIEEGDYAKEINPIKLSQRIESLQRTLKNLLERINIINEKKQNLIPKLINELTENCITVHQLRCKSGLKTSGIPENVLSEFHDEAIKYNQRCDNNQSLNTNNNNHNDNISSMFAQNMNVNEYNDHSHNYMEDINDLTEDRFNRLPQSTKQRVTYNQLDESYQLIQSLYYNQKGKKKPIAIKILANNGVKLTGQTGQAIINCLRSLKLIQTSKQGISCI